MARKAATAGVRLHLLRWQRDPEGEAVLRDAGGVTFPVIEGPMTVEAAMAAGAAPLERAAERVARLWTVASR